MPSKRHFERVLLAAVVLLIVSGSTGTAQAPAAQPSPTSQPLATEPTFDLSGDVSIDAGWSFQQPDLRRVVVYLDTDPKLAALSEPPASATVAQQNKTFIPNFIAVERGTSVEFPNYDDFDHNVFSFSKAAPAFDLDRYPKGKSKTRVFDKVGIVQIFCNIHPKMRAIIVVTPSSFFARPDEKGHFVIHNVPVGSFKLVAWQERCTEQPIDVTIGSSGQARPAHVVLHMNRRSIVASEAPPDSGGYGVERGLGVKREKLNLPVVQGVHDAPPENGTH